jgi:pheromone a factor receptor
MRYPQYPVVAALACVLLLVPLPAQIRARNVAVLAGMTYLIATSIVYFVNTIVWAGNVRVDAPVWCDISEHSSTSVPFPSLRTAIGSTIWFMSQYGVEGAALCVCKQLERITSSRNAAANKRSRVTFEVLVCCVLPMLSIPLRTCSAHCFYARQFTEIKGYSLSSNRYVILENYGCLPAIWPSKLSMALAFGPQLILAFLILLYSCAPTPS